MKSEHDSLTPIEIEDYIKSISHPHWKIDYYYENEQDRHYLIAKGQNRSITISFAPLSSKFTIRHMVYDQLLWATTTQLKYDLKFEGESYEGKCLSAGTNTKT